MSCITLFKDKLEFSIELGATLKPFCLYHAINNWTCALINRHFKSYPQINSTLITGEPGTSVISRTSFVKFALMLWPMKSRK